MVVSHDEPDPVLHVLGLDEVQGQSLQRLTVLGSLEVGVERLGVMGPLTWGSRVHNLIFNHILK